MEQWTDRSYKIGGKKVTDPEEYVPLYTINESIPDNWNNITLKDNINLKLDIRTYNSIYNSNEYKGTEVDKIKEELNNMLIAPITKHSLSLSFADYHADTEIGYFTEPFSSFQYLSSHTIIGFGILAYTSSNYITTLKSNLYPTVSIPVSTVKPLVIIVIKAKYVPLMRASLWLKKPIQLPLDAMKWIVSLDINAHKDWLVEHSTIRAYRGKVEPITEHLTGEEILYKYMIDKKIDCSKERTLQLALAHED